jgi:hypothetical protein
MIHKYPSCDPKEDQTLKAKRLGLSSCKVEYGQAFQLAR